MRDRGTVGVVAHESRLEIHAGKARPLDRKISDFLFGQAHFQRNRLETGTAAAELLEVFDVLGFDQVDRGKPLQRVVDVVDLLGNQLELVGRQVFRQYAPLAIENEAANGLGNVNGSIAMARTGDPHSATAQFFINHKYNKFLDYPGQDGWGYCVFGKVTDGMDVIDKIKIVETTNRAGHSDVPVDPVVIEKAEITD